MRQYNQYRCICAIKFCIIMEKKQTAVEFLAEKYNYITWMRNRDEISAGMADEWRKHYLDQAKEMEKRQITDAYHAGIEDVIPYNYFENTYKSKDNESND